MKAWNSKKKTKHTTKIKWKLCIFNYFPFEKSSKKKSYADFIFGEEPMTQKRYF